MEWNRGASPTQPATQPVNHTAGPTHKSKGGSFLNLRVASVGLLFCVAVLILALAAFVMFGGPTSESKYVSGNKMQAVFLNGGQVYFGRIGALNSKFMQLNDIYYLRVNQTVQPDGSASQSNQGVSLVKLGCELHGPDDSMVINQDQIIFWENLKDDGQVAKAVSDYKKQNPNGQKCDQPANTSNGSNSNSSSSTNNSSNSSNTNSTTKKP